MTGAVIITSGLALKSERSFHTVHGNLQSATNYYSTAQQHTGGCVNIAKK